MFFLTSLVVSGISLSASMSFFSKPDLSVSRLIFKAISLVSIVFTFATNLSYTVFLTTSLFTILLSLLESTETVFNLTTSILSTSAFNLANFGFNARLDVSIQIALFKSVFVA